MKCKKCDIQIWGNSKFCSNCGEPVEVVQTSSTEQDPQHDFPVAQADWSDAASKITSKLADSLGNKKMLLGGGVALIVLVGLILISNPAATLKPKPPTYSQIITPLILQQVPDSTCTGLKYSIDSFKSKGTLDDLKSQSKSINSKNFSPRQALAYANKNLKGYVGSESTTFEIAVEGNAQLALESTLQNQQAKLGAGADWKALASDWKTGWTTDLLDRCLLKNSYDEKNLILSEFDAATSKILALANSVPWYPDGFNQYTDENIAWKWSHESCGYLSCFHMKVVTKTGCSGGLYAEVNELDGAGNVVGFTNDTLGSLNPGVIALLNFPIVEDSTRTGQISKISCY